MALGHRELSTRGPFGRRSRDPFPSTADPAEYVPRDATESVLDALEAALEGSQAPLALTGPPRLGKTLLARVLALRLAGRFRTVHLAYSALPPEPLCAWALRELGEQPGENPEAELLAAAHRSAEQGRPLLLAVDDGSALPVPTVRGLCDLAAVSRGALRLLIVASDQQGVPAVLAALGSEFREVRHTEPMSARETGVYLRRRLERAGAPRAVRARFDGDEILRLHRDSCGVPGLLHRLADRVVLRGSWLEVGLPAPAPTPPSPPEPRLEMEEGASGEAGSGTVGRGGAPVPAGRREEAGRGPQSPRVGEARWPRALLLALLAGLLAGAVLLVRL